jgi:hypothetical protein
MRGIRIGTESATTVDIPYTEGSSLTVNMWIRLNWENATNATNYDLFSWNGFYAYVRTSNTGNQYQLRGANGQPGFINGNYDISPDQDILITYVYRYNGASNELEIYQNGQQVAQRVETTAEDSFSAPFKLGAHIADSADMTIFSVDARTAAMSPTEIETYYNEQTMPTLGMSALGAPLTFPDALLTVQGHAYNPLPILADYSGNGYDLTFSGSGYSYAAGDLLTTLPQPGDNHIVQQYETTPGGGTQPVPRSSVYSPTFDFTNNGYVFGSTGALRAGSGIVDNTQTTLSRDGATYTVPDVAYSRGLDGTWSKFFPNIVVASSSLGYDDSSPYTGFPVT